MNNKVVKRVVIGFALYAVFALAVLMYYPDSPEDMGWEDRQGFNKVQIAKLELGTSRQEVLSLLGSPDISEAKKLGNTQLQVMFYRTQHKKADGITTQDECTPLLFKDDELVAWGDDAYTSYRQDG